MISSYGEFRSRGRGKRARNHKKKKPLRLETKLRVAGGQVCGGWDNGYWGLRRPRVVMSTGC